MKKINLITLVSFFSLTLFAAAPDHKVVEPKPAAPVAQAAPAPTMEAPKDPWIDVSEPAKVGRVNPATGEIECGSWYSSAGCKKVAQQLYSALVQMQKAYMELKNSKVEKAK